MIFKSIIIAFVAAPFCAYAIWLVWQGGKRGTILKRGAWTSRNGSTIGFLGFMAIFATVAISSVYVFLLGWFTLLALIATLYLAERYARWFEGFVYATEAELETPTRFLQRMPYTDREEALSALNKVYPDWWVSKMPLWWRAELEERLSKHFREKFPDVLKQGG